MLWLFSCYCMFSQFFTSITTHACSTQKEQLKHSLCVANYFMCTAQYYYTVESTDNVHELFFVCVCVFCLFICLSLFFLLLVLCIILLCSFILLSFAHPCVCRLHIQWTFFLFTTLVFCSHLLFLVSLFLRSLILSSHPALINSSCYDTCLFFLSLCPY